MIAVIARKEFTEFRRDSRFRLAASLMLVLLLAGSLLGWRNYLDLEAQAEAAAEHDYQRWQQQDPKHPHDAAHNGVYVFKTPRPLAVVDGGIEPYVGASIMNGAHIQGEAEFPPVVLKNTKSPEWIFSLGTGGKTSDISRTVRGK